MVLNVELSPCRARRLCAPVALHCAALHYIAQKLGRVLSDRPRRDLVT